MSRGSKVRSASQAGEPGKIFYGRTGCAPVENQRMIAAVTREHFKYSAFGPLDLKPSCAVCQPYDARPAGL